MTLNIDDKTKSEIKEQVYAEMIAGLTLFQDKALQLSPLGEVNFEGRPTLGIRVSSKGHRDVNVYFDKENGLLIKLESRAVDLGSGQEVSQEKVFSDYKVIDGIMRPRKVVIFQDGKKLLDVQVIELKFLDRLDDSVFAKP